MIMQVSVCLILDSIQQLSLSFPYFFVISSSPGFWFLLQYLQHTQFSHHNMLVESSLLEKSAKSENLKTLQKYITVCGLSRASPAASLVPRSQTCHEPGGVRLWRKQVRKVYPDMRDLTDHWTKYIIDILRENQRQHHRWWI